MARRKITKAQISDLLPTLDRKLSRFEYMMRSLREPLFVTEQKQIKQAISMGMTLDEARLTANIVSDQRWDAHINILAVASYSPGTIMLHYRQRSRTRYEMTMDLMKRAQKAKDRKIEMQCILTLCKLDASEAELAQALGLVKIQPRDDGHGGSGFDSGDMATELERIELEIEARVNEVRNALPPITVDLQSRPDPRQDEDIVGPITVSESSTGGDS